MPEPVARFGCVLGDESGRCVAIVADSNRANAPLKTQLSFPNRFCVFCAFLWLIVPVALDTSGTLRRLRKHTKREISRRIS